MLTLLIVLFYSMLQTGQVPSVLFGLSGMEQTLHKHLLNQ